jgi:hypothetical protein
MSKIKRYSNEFCGRAAKPDSEKGAALVIAILIMLLLVGFVSLVVSRVTTETVITSIDSSENGAMAATEANLESTTRDFADIFERKLVPTRGDIETIKAGTIADFGKYQFTKDIKATADAEPTEIIGGTYAGLYSLRDVWEVDITAKDTSTYVETQLRRRILNDRIPLFQFGIFYEKDLELNRPPLFTFGGRVHTNANLFITASPTSVGNGIYFRSKTTVVGEIVNDIWKTGTGLAAGTDDQNSVFVADAGGTFRQLNTGSASVNCRTPSGTNVFAYDANLPNCSKNSSWLTNKAIFQGNLESNTNRLDLPLSKLNIDLNELIKRGKNVGDTQRNAANNIDVPVTVASQDSIILSRERFANKQGMRVTLADAKDRLPGCVGVNPCGVQLDGAYNINPALPTIGYQPLTMQDGYKATAFNATRLAQTGKGVWIKVELVDYDFTNNVPITKDITEDILSLGVTERAPISSNFQISGYGSDGLSNNSPQKTDVRAIVKLQRFTIPGPTIANAAGTSYLTNKTIGTDNHNLIVRYTNVNIDPSLLGCVYVSATVTTCGTTTASSSFSAPLPNAHADATSSDEDRAHLKWVKFNNGAGSPYDTAIAPFPIQVFDGREGLPNDSLTYTNTFGTDKVPRAGVMSMIDIDVANLRRFLSGDFDGDFPTATSFATNKGAGLSLESSDIPENKGWVLYVSDRRGDADFDGEYDMEDVFPDNIRQFNEDVNFNGTLEENAAEAPDYSLWYYKSQGATSDHGYYRRGVRLINASVVPGEYNSAAPRETQGFTVASENGVYVQGNYNATGVTLSGNTSPALSENYFPQNSSTHIPAAIVSDAVTILSNNWQDSKSFAFPFAPDSRPATQTIVRFAMLSGQGLTGRTGGYNPSQFGQLNGGVHNFKRYLEAWSGVRLNYSGSLVNLFTSRNNNGFFKCCVVYNPPIRDWSFDKTFLNANRLPPGTPYIYTMAFTGFQRVSD